LVYRARQIGVTLPLLESALPSNSEHLRRAIDVVLERSETRIGVIGLAFKEDTDDLRESPVVALIEQLIGKGRDVRVYDPHIRLDSIYGTNRDFVLKAIPHIGKLMLPALDDVLDWADCLVVAQKPSPAAAEKIQAVHVPVIDLAGGVAFAR